MKFMSSHFMRLSALTFPIAGPSYLAVDIKKSDSKRASMVLVFLHARNIMMPKK